MARLSEGARGAIPDRFVVLVERVEGVVRIEVVRTSNEFRFGGWSGVSSPSSKAASKAADGGCCTAGGLPKSVNCMALLFSEGKPSGMRGSILICGSYDKPMDE